MYYRNYSIYVRIFPDSDWQFVVQGRICFKVLKEYDKILGEIRHILNKNSIYEFKIVSFYDENTPEQLELPY